jgi:hypothetical protein
MKELRFSARKGRVVRKSPHRISTERPVSPHPSKKAEKSIKAAPEDPQAIAIREMRNRTLVGHGWNYEKAFLNAGDRFWEDVKALRNIDRVELDKRKLVLGRHTLGLVQWGTQFPSSLSDRFVSAFIQAIRDRNFPKRRKPQARFLGDSLGADGEVSARRSRDICGEERAKLKRAVPAKLRSVPSWWEPQAEKDWRAEQWNRLSVEYRSQLLAERTGTPAPEIYIDCCGKKRWTVNQRCPECQRNPVESTLPLSLLL